MEQTLMKLGLDSYSYHYAAGLWEYTPQHRAALSVEDYLTKAAELDLDGIQLCDARHLESLDEAYLRRLREKAASLGLYVELGTGGADPEHLRSMLAAADLLGAPVVRTFVGGRRPSSPEGLADALAAVASQLRGVVPVCEQYGIPLAVENHQDFTTQELLGMLDMVGGDWIGLCFDTGNTLAMLEDPLASAREAAHAIKSLHFKDYQVAAVPEGFALIGCALGEGVIDLEGIAAFLGAEAPQANLNIETYVGKHIIPVMSEEYQSYLANSPTALIVDLPRTLDVVREKGLPTVPELPIERDAAEAEILADEDDLFRRSVRWAKKALGRGGGR
jgi:sugar phosphate isomerase/epimerase